MQRVPWELEKRSVQKTTDILFLPQLCHFNWLFRSSFFIGPVHLFPISWTCVLWSRQSLELHSRCLYFPDKWIWQKNCLGKAIPQASQQFLPSFFTSIEEGNGDFDCSPCTQRYSGSLTWLLCSTNQFLFPVLKGDMRRNLSSHCILSCICVCVCWKDRGIEERKEPTSGSSERFHYLWVPLLYLCRGDPSICFTPDKFVCVLEVEVALHED